MSCVYGEFREFVGQGLWVDLMSVGCGKTQLSHTMCITAQVRLISSKVHR